MEERPLTLSSRGITLRGTVVTPTRGSGWPLAILCHGIPSGAPAQGDPGYPALARRFAEHGVAACFFNFRGTGESGGDFSLPGWMEDLDTVLDAAADAAGPFVGCDPRRIALMGFSGGGAVSIVCAARRGGLAAVATLSAPADFTRLMTREGIGAFIAHARAIGIIRDPDYPPSEEEYYREMLACDPAREAGKLAPVPLLVVHGDRDDLVPVEEAHRLYAAASEPKDLLIVRGGEHKLRLNPEAMDTAVSWLLAKLGVTS